ncbi:MAG: aminotransferase class IV [Pirellulaceae bacterium]
MKNSLAYSNGCWLPTADVHLSMDDIGLLQGVVVVDRLRTLDHRVLDAQPHVDRFLRSCHAIGITPPPAGELLAIIQRCLSENRGKHFTRDFSLVVLATPGRVGAPRPLTLIVHPLEIRWPQLHAWYTVGQALTTATSRSVPAACWSPSIKTRNRLNYFLADRQTQATTGDGNAAAVLQTLEGNLTETSAANLLLVEGQRIISPHAEDILWGVSLQRTLRLAAETGLEVVQANVPPNRAKAADAIILCGTTGCLWSASRFDTTEFVSPSHHPVFRQLLDAWIADVGFDFVHQASMAQRSQPVSAVPPQ